MCQVLRNWLLGLFSWTEKIKIIITDDSVFEKNKLGSSGRPLFIGGPSRLKTFLIRHVNNLQIQLYKVNQLQYISRGQPSTIHTYICAQVRINIGY